MNEPTLVSGVQTLADYNPRKQQLDDIAHKLQAAVGRKAVAAKELKRFKDTIPDYFDDTENEDLAIDPDLIAHWAGKAGKRGYKSILEASETEAQELAVIYGQMTCRPLCETMQQKLPREIRDMVYRFLLVNPSTVDCGWVYSPTDLTECHYCIDSGKPGSGCWEHILMDLRSAEYLGIRTLTEVAETWYHTSEFGLYSGLYSKYTFDDLLREKNRWELPFQPIGVINKVHIDFLDWKFMEYEGIEDGSEEWELPAELATELLNGFSNLSKLKAGAKITVSLRLRLNCWKESAQKLQRLIDILNPTFSVLKTLHEQGYEILVEEECETSKFFSCETSKFFSKATLTAKEWVESNIKRS